MRNDPTHTEELRLSDVLAELEEVEHHLETMPASDDQYVDLEERRALLKLMIDQLRGDGAPVTRAQAAG